MARRKKAEFPVDGAQLGLVTGADVSAWLDRQHLTPEAAAVLLGVSYAKLLRMMRDRSRPVSQEIAAMLSTGMYLEAKVVALADLNMARAKKARAARLEAVPPEPAEEVA